jgi:hypothetical protein
MEPEPEPELDMDGGFEAPFDGDVPSRVGVVDPELDSDRAGEAVLEDELEWLKFRACRSTSPASKLGFRYTRCNFRSVQLC